MVAVEDVKVVVRGKEEEEEEVMEVGGGR